MAKNYAESGGIYKQNVKMKKTQVAAEEERQLGLSLEYEEATIQSGSPRFLGVITRSCQI
jgi:hypothetical protein